MRILISIAVILLTFTSCYKGESADLVIHNAKIYTLDGELNVYEAVAIRDGKIIELGPNRQILNKYSAEQTIDAQMRPIFPGFIDAHGHLYSQAQLDLQVDLNHTSSKKEIIDRLKSKEKVNGWIQGRGWDHSLWTKDTLLNNNFINKAFPNTPIFIKRLDGHAALVNQKAIEITGIDSITTIEGGLIERKDNEMTGLLLDNAIELITQQIPQLDEATMVNALINAQKNCIKYGITGVHEAGVYAEGRDIFIKATESEDWDLPLYLMLFPTDENLDFAQQEGHYENKYLTIRSFKMVADGALGSHGACLIHPYNDQPVSHGIMTTQLEKIKETCQVAKALDYQVNTHCIGDSANQYVLNTYASELKADNDLRWRIEHAQVVQPKDIALFKKHNIIPSIQPTHATTDMRWAEERLGKERLQKEGYRAQTFIDEGNIIALGTDFPVESYNPFRTFYAAISRQNEDGWPANGFLPEEKISRLDALKGMTFHAAMASFQEKLTGSLEVGKKANLIMLSNDILEISKEEVLKTNIIYTIIDGNVVYKGL